MNKFYSISLGPILFETRFKHFLDKNKDTLDYFTWVVDNYDLYEPYKEYIDLIDIKSSRIDHPWSNEYEVSFDEKDHSLFLKNFKEYCLTKHTYPLDLQRLAFKDFYEKDILNITYVGTNLQISNNKENLEEYFNKIPKGMFIFPYWNAEPANCFFSPHVKSDLHLIYPSLDIPDDYYYFDGWGYGFHFFNKEDLILFYRIWDDILKIIFNNNISHIFKTTAGYSNYEAIVGYVMRIFVKNFGYKIDNIHNYWDSHKTGMHLSLAHDTWHYGGLRTWSEFGFTLDNIQTISDYIEKNQEPLKAFYDRYTDRLEYKILPNNVELRFKF